MLSKIMEIPKQVNQGRLPGQLVVQITNRCNAQCPQCGMRVTEHIHRNDLSVDEIKRMIDAAAIRGIQAISFTGGEPFLRLNDLTTLINHAALAGIHYIRTGTNGFMFMRHKDPGYLDRVKRLADTLAATPLRNLWISIDSARPETHDQMRGLPGVTEGIAKALPEFHARGLYPAANLGLNRNLGGYPLPPMSESEQEDKPFVTELTDGLRRFYKHVIDLGFTMVNTCYPMSDDTMAKGNDLAAVYAATSSDDIVSFTRRERAVLFSTLLSVIPEFRAHIRVFSPLTSLLALSRFYSEGKRTSYACRGGIDFFFIDASTGNTYPCGYRGHECYGKFWDLDLSSFSRDAHCTECDWECFRDPSELLGPVSGIFVHPFATMRRFLKDSAMRRLLIQDLRYYHACGFFDGRRAMNSRRLARYS
jgi:MoaA/NifB/PqqE/SkfB family radical SAM enzyme